MEKERDDAKKKLFALRSERKVAREDVDLAKKQAAEWKSKIAAQQEELDGFENLRIQIVKQFQDQFGENVDLDQIPGLVKELEEELKQNNKTLEELLTNVDTAERKLASSQAQIADLNQRITKRANRIKANAVHGSLTAVNHDWGFVTVRVPKNMPVNTASKLLVKRGNQYVGTLNINAIEGTRIIADIDYKSLTRGMIMQPGDAVVLSKPVTN